MSFSKLDQDGIVREAIALLGEDGLDAVSLRRVAGRLGVSVSSLYWHVKDKRALYTLMSGAIFRSCLDAMPPAQDWQTWLKHFGIVLWDKQTGMQDARRLIQMSRYDEIAAQTARTRIIAPLTALGLPEARAILAQGSVQALVTGWTTLDSARPGAPNHGRDAFLLSLDALIRGWDQA